MKSILAVLFLAFIGPEINVEQSAKYGALAIDRSNGFYYGWAYDYSSQNAASNRALQECRSRGGNCSVVLTWQGSGRCASYRTINGNVGTAYGWGVADSRQQADAIALRECQSRSGGNPCSNNVWACNGR